MAIPSIIPIVGALGLVKKGTAKHLEKIPGKKNEQRYKKIVVTSTKSTHKSVMNIIYNKIRQKKRVRFFMIF